MQSIQITKDTNRLQQNTDRNIPGIRQHRIKCTNRQHNNNINNYIKQHNHLTCMILEK